MGPRGTNPCKFLGNASPRPQLPDSSVNVHTLPAGYTGAVGPPERNGSCEPPGSYFKTSFQGATCLNVGEKKEGQREEDTRAWVCSASTAGRLLHEQ